MVKGAIEHELPVKYIEKLMQIVDNGYVGKVDLSVSAWFTLDKDGQNKANDIVQHFCSSVISCY